MPNSKKKKRKESELENKEESFLKGYRPKFKATPLKS